MEQPYNERQASKAGYISKVFLDSYKSPLSIILIDDLERVIDFVRTGPRFSNTVLQTLLVLLKKVRVENGHAGEVCPKRDDRGPPPSPPEVCYCRSFAPTVVANVAPACFETSAEKTELAKNTIARCAGHAAAKQQLLAGWPPHGWCGVG